MAFVLGTFRNDTLTGTQGDDIILGIFGDDVLRGRDGNDFLDGDEGTDQLFGDNGRDILLGGLGDDRLEGGNGNDYLDGGVGLNRDLMFGGNGDDTLLFRKANHRGELDGGRGIDTAQLYLKEDFDLRGVLSNVERIEQGEGHAQVLLDEQFFLTADSSTVVIDLGEGHQDKVHVIYDGDRLDFDLVAGKIKFGEPGDLDKTLVLDDVESLWLSDTNDPTGNFVFDHWLV